MKQLWKKIINFFKKNKDFPKPYLGATWNEYLEDRKLIIKILKHLSNSHITSEEFVRNTSFINYLVWINLRKIRATLNKLNRNSEAKTSLSKMKHSCIKFLSNQLPLDCTQEQYDLNVKYFVRTFNLQAAVLIDLYGIEIDDELKYLELDYSLI